MPINTVYPNIPDNFVSAMRAGRTLKGLSVKKLAKITEFHPGYISEVENGKRNVNYERATVFNQVLELGFELPAPDQILIDKVKRENGWKK